MAQARNPPFTRAMASRIRLMGVGDGHAACGAAARPPGGRGGAAPPLGQAVFDRFCRDMDDSMRRWGWATWRCREGCAASARPSTGDRRHIGRRWRPRPMGRLPQPWSAMYLPARRPGRRGAARRLCRATVPAAGRAGRGFARGAARFPDPDAGRGAGRDRRGCPCMTP